MRCVLCESIDVTARRGVESPYLPVTYTLFQCASCGSRFFDPGEHEVDLQAVYDDDARAGVHAGREFVRTPAWQAEVSRIAALCVGPVRAVLDVGCRTGDFLMHWPTDVRRVGVELATPSAAIARSRGLEIVEQPLERTDLDTRFDAVTCYAILEHLTDPGPVMDSLARSVVPGGVLVVMVPAFESAKAGILERLHRPWHQYNPPQHFCFYSRKFLDAFFSERGFSLRDRRYTSGGMFNPFDKFPIARRAFSLGLGWVESHTALPALPVFDHMYSYYTAPSATEL